MATSTCNTCFLAARNALWLDSWQRDSASAPPVADVAATLRALLEDEEEAGDALATLARRSASGAAAVRDAWSSVVKAATDDGCPGQRGALLAMGYACAGDFAVPGGNSGCVEALAACVRALRSPEEDVAEAGARSAAHIAMSNSLPAGPLGAADAPLLVKAVFSASQMVRSLLTAAVVGLCRRGAAVALLREAGVESALRKAVPSVWPALDRAVDDLLAELIKSGTPRSPRMPISPRSKLSPPVSARLEASGTLAFGTTKSLSLQDLVQRLEAKASLDDSSYVSAATQQSETEDVDRLAPCHRYDVISVVAGSDDAALACASCNKHLKGPCVSVGRGLARRLFHHTDDCFACATCGEPFRHGVYWFDKGALVCRNDYLRSIGLVCKKCGDLVTETTLARAMGGVWHSRCFVCAVCAAPFDQGGYYRHQDKPYCAVHIADILGTKCGLCGLGVVGGIKAIDRVWHEACFKCARCGLQLGAGVAFYAINNRPYCREDALRAKAAVAECAKCGKTVSQGVVIRALDKRFCGSCFVCSVCGDATIAETGFYPGATGLPVCKAHRVDASTCAGCGGAFAAAGQVVSALGKRWHVEHFTCRTCKCAFEDNEFYDIGGFPYCRKHARKQIRSPGRDH